MFDDLRFVCGMVCLVQVIGFFAAACSPRKPATLEPLVVGESTQGATATNGEAAVTFAGSSGSDDVPSFASSAASSGTEATDGDDVAPPRAVRVQSHEAPKPKAVKPPFIATALPGDGQWNPFGVDERGTVSFFRTQLHPHERSRFVSVSVVAIDLKRFRLEWVVGAADVGAASLVGKHSPGLVSDVWASEVTAVFNGGFQARHGYWGQHSHGITLVKPKVEGCGLAIYADGGVALGSYEACNHATLVTYRQAPPCLVERGAINVRLTSGQDAVWAGNSTKEKTRRRSAVGLTADRQTLFYLVGVETSPLDLARALTALEVESGLQLDINWNWTRFFLVTRAAGEANLGEPLLEGMVADKGEYLRRASKRDFFAVLRAPTNQ